MGFQFGGVANLTLGSIQVDAFRPQSGGGFRASEWSVNESFVLNASASLGNVAWNYHEFEIKREALDGVLASALASAEPPYQLLPGSPIFECLFNFEESPLTYKIPQFEPCVTPSELRRFTTTDNGDAPEIAGTFNYGRGGIDTDGDGLRDNAYPVVENAVYRFLSGWAFDLKFTAASNDVVDYAVRPISVPDGWFVGSDDPGGFAPIFDRTWTADNVEPGEEVITRWAVQCRDPFASPARLGFELLEDGTFSNTPLDTLYVDVRKEGNVSIVNARTTQGSSSSAVRAHGTSTPAAGKDTSQLPFSVSVETPSGTIIDASSVDRMQSQYLEADIDSSGTRDAQLAIYNPEGGAHEVRIESTGEGETGRRVTVESVTSTEVQTLVDDEPVPDTGATTATYDPASQIPVELTSFTATHAGSSIRLRWKTATEDENAGFAVQRKVGDSTFERIGFVEGAGTTTVPQAYRFRDDAIPFGAGQLTYRLKQVDADGSFEYSSTVRVSREAPDRLALHGNFPNPFRGRTTIRYELPRTGHVQVEVYNVFGQRIATLVNEKQTAGQKTVGFDGSQIASGVYFVRLRALGKQRVKKLTVNR
jgi:hypothetical protein